MTKSAVYIRTNNETLAEEQYYLSKINKLGLENEELIIYKDSRHEKIQLQQLLNDAQNNAIRSLWICDSEHISRLYSEVISVMMQLAKHNVDIRFLIEKDEFTSYLYFSQYQSKVLKALGI